MVKCESCRGSGRIVLFTSAGPCDACKGTGKAPDPSPAKPAEAPNPWAWLASTAPLIGRITLSSEQFRRLYLNEPAPELPPPPEPPDDRRPRYRMDRQVYTVTWANDWDRLLEPEDKT